MDPRSSMVLQEDQLLTESIDGFQIFWPQMTYLRLRVLRLFITHSAISWPETVGTCFPNHQLPQFTHQQINDENKTYTTSIRAHKVDRLAGTMIRRRARLAVTDAVDLPDPSGESGHDRLRARHRHLQARAHGRVGRRGVAAETRGGRRAALHLRWAGAVPRGGGAGAVGLPAAVTARVGRAGRLGAALDVGGVGRASTGDGSAAGAGAVGGGNADTYKEKWLEWKELKEKEMRRGVKSGFYLPAAPPEPMQGSLTAAMATEAARRERRD